MEDVTFRLGGLAQNLEDPATPQRHRQRRGPRHRRLGRRSPEVARALGTRIDLFADAALNPGGPIELNQLQVSGNGLSIFSAGELRGPDLHRPQRHPRRRPRDLRRPRQPRRSAAAIDLRANGSVTPLSGGFDLTFDGSTTDLALGDARLDALLAGETTLSGRAVRDEAGIRTENLRLDNPQLTFASNGQISSTRTDIGFDAAPQRPRARSTRGARGG